MSDDSLMRLASARPEVSLISPATLAHQILDVYWDHDNTVETYVCHELSRSHTDRCVLGFYSSYHEGTFPMFIRFGARDLVTLAGLPAEIASAIERIVDRGVAAEGRAQWSYYLHGANLDELARAGVRLTPGATAVLRAAVCDPLRGLHGAGRAHGALTARSIRLVAAPEPYAPFEAPAPIRLCNYHGVSVTESDAVREIEVAVAAVDALAGGRGELTDLWAAVAEACPLIGRVYWHESGRP